MTKSEVYARLFALGYLTAKRPSKYAADKAVKAFQSDQGIAPDGVIGPQTVRALHDPLLGFCGVREHITTHDGLCKWPESAFPLKWCVNGSLAPRISNADFKQAAMLAWGYWMEACGVVLEYTNNAKTANIVMNFGAIDHGGNTLAWSKLPCGNHAQLDQLYDSSETWVISETPNRNQIDLVRVIAHEGGHMLGCPHLSDGGALMAPMYNPSVRKPQQSDVEQMQRRYGPPKVDPTPAPPPNGWTESDWFDLTANIGVKYRVR